MCSEKVTRLHVRLGAKRKKNYDHISQKCQKEVNIKNVTFRDLHLSCEKHVWIRFLSTSVSPH